MAPSITIEPRLPLFRRAEALFTANVSDADNDKSALAIEWTRQDGTCGDVPREFPATGETYVVPDSQVDQPFCVWATVRDPHGATRRDSYPAMPENRSPTVRIAMAGDLETSPPFSLFRPVHLRAETTDPDGDEVEYVWHVYLPGGDAVNSGDLLCTKGPDDLCVTEEVSVTPYVKGTYTVDLVTRDGHGGESLTSRSFDVADDAWPCLRETMPVLGSPELPRSAAESVPITVTLLEDDGDPYSQGDSFDPANTRRTFTWFTALDSAPMERTDVVLPSYVVPKKPELAGHKVRVRVEVSDRNRMRTQEFLDSCKTDECTRVPGCRQRMTWTIIYNDG